MWNTRKFEHEIEAGLKRQFDAHRAGELYGIYTTTRDKLINDVLNEFKAAEPQLSDHGTRHIANVLDNAHYLIRPDTNASILSGIELYCLGMMILFHDVGNIYGRKNHNTNIARIFDWARGTTAGVRRERTIVLSAARAHTGAASDGSSDTLKELGESESLEAEPVRLRELAAILRFADELAEGPQRTSEFMRTHGLYSQESQLFHDYASITNVHIDRGTERIRLTYELEVEHALANGDHAAINKLKGLLEFAYRRATKLDQERRYSRYYSECLTPFKATWIKLNFHCPGHDKLFDLEPVTLDDKVVPGRPDQQLTQLNPTYVLETLIDKLTLRLKELQPK